MTAPTPAPTGGTAFGEKLTAPSGGGATSSSSNLYGLGQWGTQPIPTGDLPFPIIVGSQGRATGNSIVKALTQTTDPTNIAQIQRALYLGGFYTSTYQPNLGVLSAEDLKAFNTAVTLAGKTQTPLSDVLLQHAQMGVSAGITQARQVQQAAVKPAIAEVQLDNPQALEATAVKNFEATLGRKATPAEAAAFSAAYRSMEGGIERANNVSENNATQAQNIEQAGGLSANQAASDDAALNAATDPKLHAAHQQVAGQPDWLESAQSQSFSQELQSLGEVANQAQQQAIPAGADATGSNPLTQVTQEAPEDPDDAAANFARDTHPNEAAASDTANTFDQFLQILSSNFGGAPA